MMIQKMKLKIKLRNSDFTIVTSCINKGIEKFSDQFDIQNYAKNISYLNTLVLVLMNDNEKILSQFQWYNTLNLHNEEDNSQNDFTLNIPKLIPSHNDHCLSYSSEVSNMFAKYFESSTSYRNLKLLKSVFWQSNLWKSDLNMDSFDHNNRSICSDQPYSSTKHSSNKMHKTGKILPKINNSSDLS